MDCQDVLDQLADYLDDDARSELCRQIEEHLARCRDCQVEVDTVKKTIVLYQAGSRVESAGARERGAAGRVVARVRARQAA